MYDCATAKAYAGYLLDKHKRYSSRAYYKAKLGTHEMYQQHVTKERSIQTASSFWKMGLKTKYSNGKLHVGKCFVKIRKIQI